MHASTVLGYGTNVDVSVICGAAYVSKPSIPRPLPVADIHDYNLELR